MRQLRLWGLAISLVGMACLACTSQTGATQAALDRSSYPEGPYGRAEGDVIENLTFVDISDKPFALHDVFSNTSQKLLLISTAAGWCTACIEEQPALQQLHEAHHAAGLAVVVAVFEDASFEPADARLAQVWQEQHRLSFPVVADPDFILADYYDPALTPMNMMVDLNTMEILRVTTGWDASVVDAVIRARL